MARWAQGALVAGPVVLVGGAGMATQTLSLVCSALAVRHRAVSHG